MAFVQPAARRSVVSDTPEGLEITIPQRRNWLMVLFLAAWSVGWFFGEASAVREILSGKAELFLFAWLTMWTAGGCVVAYVLLRQLTGYQRVVAHADRLTIETVVAGLSRKREYAAEHVRELRVAPHLQLDRAARLWGVAGVPIAFNYGAKTVTFAQSLDEAESAIVVREIESRLPSCT